MKTRVIIVRHGESTFNVKRIIQGHHDESVLTETGEAQAHQVGQLLRGIAVDAVYSSPLKRAARTAALVIAAMRSQQPQTPDPQFQDGLKEISLPLWEAKSFTEVADQYPEAYRAWREQPADLKMQVPQADGSLVDFYPVRAVWAQAEVFWQTVLAQHPGQTLLIIAHSAINRALIGSAIGLGPESLNHLYQANCGISVLNFTQGWGQPAQLESMNLTSHTGQPLPSLRMGFKGPRLLLVRHGETDWNREQRFQGQIDVPLNANGHQQAAQAAEFLKTVPIHGAVSSSLLRPRETAEKILKYHDVPLVLSEALWEISHGTWEGKFEPEIEAAYPGLLAAWQTQPETVQMPEGENLQQVWTRAIAAWQEIVERYSGSATPQTVLVVAHDAINKAILCHAAGLGPEAFWQFKQGNGAVSVIDYPDGVNQPPTVSAVNITTHLSGSIFDMTAAGAL